MICTHLWNDLGDIKFRCQGNVHIPWHCKIYACLTRSRRKEVLYHVLTSFGLRFSYFFFISCVREIWGYHTDNMSNSLQTSPTSTFDQYSCGGQLFHRFCSTWWINRLFLRSLSSRFFGTDKRIVDPWLKSSLEWVRRSWISRVEPT